jgi:aspartyl-tRNA(Asn)/glutamyl-tRNA(Gln) amidotransferase subunit C
MQSKSGFNRKSVKIKPAPKLLKWATFEPMEVNEALIDKLATLSRLELSGAEKLDMGRELERMISFVNKLQELDLSGTPPLLQMNANQNIWRADFAEESLTREQALQSASEANDNFFKVPKVIKK